MDGLAARSVSRPRFQMVLVFLFASVALSLAGMGTYGVLSQFVTRRYGEIGLRVALGADRSAVMGLVLRQCVTLLVAGITVGLGIALVSTRLLESLLYETSPTEPLALLGSSAVLAGIGLLAALGPVIRAVRVDPIETLRSE